MEKIVITGGLGYIGTQLCNLYSGESRFKKIVVIDNRFLSGSVKQLKDWNIEFINGSVLDVDLMKRVLHDADVVYHLAGITDVAYTKTESNTEKDKQIIETGTIGTRNIINSVPDTCKIIFPSTHVVYEGFAETKFDISEEVPPTPVLTYSKSKVQSEQDLIASNKNFVILRLGSVYGYSTDTMRINIMPNLFSKIASQNGTIQLYAGGIQYKSLVALIDVARGFKFMAESTNINREIFHLTNENMSVKEVALLCKEVNPKINLIETNNEIPNLGYTLSNKKLLSTGFKFRYDIKSCIKEMVNNWSFKQDDTGLEYIIRGEKEFIDNRGKISNYGLTEPINLIGYIESKAGTVRANHYHPIQEQKVLLISGKYISVFKDLSDPKSLISTQLVVPGDLIVTKPNVAHTMVFVEDSVLLNLVRGEREHENYGITHTIPYKLVDEEFRKDLVENYKEDCRCCGNKKLKRVVSLGNSPLANNLLDTVNDKDKLYPLELNYCPDCHNCQLSYTVPSKEMFDNYLYVSSTTKTFRKHFEDAAEQYVKEFHLNKDSFVIDIGSNDGIALKPLKEKGIKVLGVEPAKNIAKMANDNGIETITDYFNDEVVSKILSEYKKADLITASNVFAHANDLKSIANNVFQILKDNGSFVVEVQYLLDTIKDLTFDNIYHEHFNYWSVTSINHFFKNLGFTIYKIEHINTHGGSIRVYVKNKTTHVDSSVDKFLQSEKDFGLLNFETYKNFAKRIEQAKENVNKNIKQIKDNGEIIVGYGAPAKATTFLNYFQITSKEIDYIVEDNKLKHNKFVPGVKIPIFEKQKLNENKPNKVLILAWNFAKEIKENNQEFINKGIEFINIKDLQ